LKSAHSIIILVIFGISIDFIEVLLHQMLSTER